MFTIKWLNYEKVYVIFNKLISCVSSDPQFLLVVCALISIGSFMWIVSRESRDPLLSIVIYLGLPCFMINFSGLRQALAIAITLYAFYFLQKKKIVPFVIMTLLAAGFHSSAIVFFAAYPVYYFKTENKAIQIISVIALPIVYLLRYPLFLIASRLFKQNAVADNNSAITLFLVFVAVYIFALFFGHKLNSKEYGYRNLFYLACICQAFGGVYSIAIRVGYYFMVYLALLLPEIIVDDRSQIAEKEIQYQRHYMVNSNKLIMYIIVFACFVTFGLYSLSEASWAMTNPYSFFWE